MFRLRLSLVIAGLFTLAGNAAAADLEIEGFAPSIAADGDLVAVVTAEKKSLSCTVSLDGGTTFAPPISVGQVPSGQMLGMRRGPQIAVRGKTIVIATNTSDARRVLAFRSTDAGKTWQSAEIDNPAGRSPEGLMSVAATKDGFAVVFLELIEKSMQIGLIRSTDDGKTWLKSKIIYASPAGHVCECCQPTIASDRAGNITVMFRNWLDGNRDMYAMTSKDDGATFSKAQKLGADSWKLNACPMDGGGIAYVSTDKNNDKSGAKTTLAIFRRESTLYTVRPGEREAKLGTGENGAIATTLDGPILAWETKTGVTVRAPKTEDVAIEGGKLPVLTTSTRGVVMAYAVKDGNDYKTHARLVWQAKLN